GNILFRRGQSGAANSFATPVILNPNRPARDLTLVRTPTGLAIATADARIGPTLSTSGQFVSTVSLYTIAANGKVTRRTVFTTTLLPTRIAAADLTGDNFDDLVVADALDNSIQIAFQRFDGTFRDPLTRTTDDAPSDIALVQVQNPS